MTERAERVREEVRARYGAAAREVREEIRARDGAEGLKLREGSPSQGAASACCSGRCGCGDGRWGASRYEEEDLGDAPEGAVAASMGCGNPAAAADLRPEETVLDLGSGAGLDAILSARRVGPRGRVYGLDMTEEVLSLAEENAARAGLGNVEFLKGFIEDLPLPAEAVDVIVSNCAVNLSPDKPRVFAEAFRVLRPGGRLAVTDVVCDDLAARSPDDGLSARRPLDGASARRLDGDDGPAAPRAWDPGRWAACLAGALTREEYRAGLAGAGFRDVEIVDSHPVAEGFTSAVIRARKPGRRRPGRGQKTSRSAPSRA